ncbi:hypothetical protein DFP72DRAFT_1047667 [Ephemerocybe angulata]|uniref:F-box domain-containing protein n=1 Tax=Ephemerocybe angulata TaxID=980116 RepID=A0A8H6HRB9_9AGAR|nr:hypothetical protein DFP72DRAFT_1047667 [Tulosesus angulatus]
MSFSIVPTDTTDTPHSTTNEPPPINRLPPELLLEIFQHVSGKSQSTHQTEAWVTFSHTCQYWRSIVIGFPRAWSNISFNHGPDFADMLLSRSIDSALPLTVHLTPTSATQADDRTRGKATEEVLMRALSESARLQSVRIHTPLKKHALRRVLRSWKKADQPLLVLAHLDIRGREGRLTDARELLDHKVMNSGVPALRSIDLRGAYIGTKLHFQAELGAHIQRLSLWRVYVSDSPDTATAARLISVTELLTCLKGLPHLDDLSVSRLLDVHPEASFLPLSLKNLKKLGITEPTTLTASMLLNLLRIPNAHTVHIALLKPLRGPRYLASLLRSLNTAWGPTLDDGFSDSIQYTSTPGEPTLNASTLDVFEFRSKPHSCPVHKHPAQILTVTVPENPNLPFISLLHTFREGLNLYPAQTISLCPPPGYPGLLGSPDPNRHWYYALWHFPALECLILQGEAVSPNILTIATALHLFLSLERVVIRRTAFPLGLRGSSVAPFLADFIKQLWNRTPKLRSLEFVECPGVTEADCLWLSAQVRQSVEIIWDRHA